VGYGAGRAVVRLPTPLLMPSWARAGGLPIRALARIASRGLADARLRPRGHSVVAVYERTEGTVEAPP
jgi:hypothetical protein